MTLDLSQARPPGLFRRLAAMLYDAFLLLGVLLLAVTLVVIPYELLIGEPLPRSGWVHHLYQLYLLGVLAAFLLFFWVRAGQTLGMRAWRLRLLRDDGNPLTLADGLRRLLWATLTLAPLGLLPMLFDAQGRGLYDRLSHTRPVLLKKEN